MFFKKSTTSPSKNSNHSGGGSSSSSNSSNNNDQNLINRNNSDSTIDSGNKSLSSPEKEVEKDHDNHNVVSSRINSDSWYTTNSATNTNKSENESFTSSKKFGQSPAAKRVKKLFSRYWFGFWKK